MKNCPTAVSLFSGLGGLDIGAHLAGVESLVCVDNDPEAAATLRKNSRQHDEKPKLSRAKFSWQVIEKDIKKLDPEQDILPKISSLNEQSAEPNRNVDLVIGGPPCQSFSRSNEGNRSGTNSKLGSLYESYENILAEIVPAGFVFENVVGILSSNDGDDINVIKSALAEPTNRDGTTVDYRYNISSMKLDASEYGVPQSRERVFIIGVREDIGTPPEKEDIEKSDHLDGWSTAGEALEQFNVDSNIESYQNAIRSKYAGYLSDIPQGANYQHFSDRKYENGEYIERTESELAKKEWDWRSRHWNYLLKLDPDRPAWTLQAQPGSIVGPFHWRSRRLSFIEQMRLMTIPISYEISGSPKDIQRQIGNAVPPYLGSAVIGALVDAIGIKRIPKKIEQSKCPVISRVLNQGSSVRMSITGAPWEELDEVIQQLQQGKEIELTSKRDKIQRLIDVLEILKNRIPNVEIIDVTTTTGERPNPTGSKTYRSDTPSPSILKSRIALSESQLTNSSADSANSPDSNNKIISQE